MKKAVNVLIIGGGYVSVWAYRSLLKRLRRGILAGDVKITVVSPYEYHLFHGWTAESLTGVIQNHNRRSPLSEVLRRAKIVKGSAEKIDTAANVIYVKMENGQLESFPYDHLLLGFGSYDSDSVEGIEKYGFRVKAPGEFERCYFSILNMVKQAAGSEPGAAENLLTFTVAGAGMTGVEIATNLDEYISAAKGYYPSLKNVRHRVTLLNSGEQLISALSPSLKRIRKYVENEIESSTINVLSNVRLQKVTSKGAHLNNGTLLPCSMVISTVGQCRFRLTGSESMLRDITQRLSTNEFFQVPGHPNIWGGGDACNVPYRNTNEACVSDALWAIKHGEYAGNNIARAIKGDPLKPFMYIGLGQAASLGIGKGIGELYGFQFTGMLAWVLRLFFFNYFMPSRKMMMKIIGDWIFLFLKGERKGLHLFHSSTKSEIKQTSFSVMPLTVLRNNRD